MSNDGNFAPVSGTLVRTPRPYPTESLFGYVVRLTEANGYSSPVVLWNLARIPRGRELSAGFPATHLAPLVGVAPDVLDRLAYRVAEHAYTGGSRRQGRPFKILGHFLGKSSSRQAGHLRLDACAFCPQCVAESGYIDAFWNLSVAVACPTHGRLALSRCPGCQQDIPWRRARLNNCSCGCDFRGVECRQAPAPLVLLVKLVQAVLHGQPLEGLSGMPTQFLTNLPLSALLSLIDRLGYLLRVNPDHGNGPGKSSKRRRQRGITVKGGLTDRVEAYVSVSQALGDWPRGFHRALDAIDPRITGRAGGDENYRQEADLFYQSLLRSNVASQHFSFLRTEYARHWNGADHVAQLPQAPSGVHDRREMLSSSMDELQTNAPVGPVIADRNIPKVVGLPVSVLEVLRRQGIYGTSSGRGSSYNWYQNDIETFRERLHAVMKSGAIRPSRYKRPTVTVKQAMSLNLRSAQAKADVIAALLDGRLRAIANAHTPFGEVQIDKDQLDKFLLEKRVAVEGDTYSFPQCARICGIDQSAIQDAVNQGLLHGVQRLERLRISAQSARAFNAKYVPLSKLAGELGSTSTGLQNLCQRLGCSIVRLKRAGATAMQPLVLREQVPEILRGITQEAANREKKSLIHRRDDWKKRLRAYLSGLEAKGKRLPRRSGKPDKSRIARACAFDRNLLYRSPELIKIIDEADSRERKTDKSAGMSQVDRMRIYLTGIAARGERIPLWGNSPNLRALAESCGVDRNVFYSDSGLLRMIESIEREATAEEADKSHSRGPAKAGRAAPATPRS